MNDKVPQALRESVFQRAERQRIVEYLVRFKHPLATSSIAPQEEKDAAHKFRIYLYGVQFDELVCMEKETQLKVMAYQEAEVEQQDRSRFFHQPQADADFQYWAMRAYWSIDEGVALLLGKAPEVVTPKSIEKVLYNSESNFARRFKRLRDLAGNHVGGLLTDPVHPSVLLRWAQRFDQPIPEELASAVAKYSQFIGDWQDAYNKVRKEADDLSASMVHYQAAYEEAQNKFVESIEQMRVANGVIQSQRRRIAALEAQLTEQSDEQDQVEEPDEVAQPLVPRPARMRPVGGDVLTPMVWDVCYEIYEAGGRVTAGTVMATLQKMAASDDPAVKGCLLSVVRGGVKWEPLSSDSDEDQELNTNSLNQRIREWRRKTGLGQPM